MPHSKRTAVIPSQDWQVPAATWTEIIDRYFNFIQVPSWRASVKSDGGEKRTCLLASEATELREQMFHAIDRVLLRAASDRDAKTGDLARLAKHQGRHIPRDRRCPKKVGSHLQRAFLFNAAGYTCLYCGRTAWGVCAEETGTEPRRTLRFEVDHGTTRRRLPDPARFDPANLVVACRSCNTIKAEMTEGRFRRELESLASAVHRARVKNSPKTV